MARLVNATKSPLTKLWGNYSSQKDTKQLISVLAQSCVLCFFDATKAFDRFNYVKLFRILVERGLPPYIITVLINMCCVILGLSRDALYWKMKMYFTQQACVSWAGIASAYFPVFIGVRQGGVLSPLLFCVYIDNLLLRLSNSGVGYYIGTNLIGALAYADDIVLLSPTPAAARKLLSICETYAADYDIKFNAQKSKLLVALLNNRHRQTSHLRTCSSLSIDGFDGSPIERVESFSHLVISLLLV